MTRRKLVKADRHRTSFTGTSAAIPCNIISKVTCAARYHERIFILSLAKRRERETMCTPLDRGETFRDRVLKI